jgi:hypothetical protein
MMQVLNNSLNLCNSNRCPLNVRKGTLGEAFHHRERIAYLVAEESIEGALVLQFCLGQGHLAPHELLSILPGNFPAEV